MRLMSLRTCCLRIPGGRERTGFLGGVGVGRTLGEPSWVPLRGYPCPSHTCNNVHRGVTLARVSSECTKEVAMTIDFLKKSLHRASSAVRCPVKTARGGTEAEWDSYYAARDAERDAEALISVEGQYATIDECLDAVIAAEMAWANAKLTQVAAAKRRLA